MPSAPPDLLRSAGAPASADASDSADRRHAERDASIPSDGPLQALRLALPAAALSSLRRHPLLRALAAGGRATRSELHGVYWDTPNLDLAEAGVALRMRRVGANAVQTLESRAGVGLAAAVSRESDALVASARPNLDAIPDPELRASLASSVDLATLTPVFELRIDRTRRVLHEDGGTLRFDVDVGEIRSARGVVPICDVEIAGRAEDPGHPVRLALELLEALPLRPLGRTLAERGYERASGRGPATYKARPVAVGDGALLEELLVAIAGSGLAQLIENEPAAALGVDPEGVHQVRVGARRLRSALAFFRSVLPERQRAWLRDELRWLTSALGPARDLDVFTTELLDPLVSLPEADPGLVRLRAAAQAAREEAQRCAVAALESPRWTRLVLETSAWVAHRAWREQPLDEHSARLFLPAPLFVAPLLERRHKRVRRLGNQLAEASVEERHQLRIQLKKLRYAAEFTACLHPGKRAERYARRLARLQDALGHLNDVANAERQLASALARLGETPSLDDGRAAGFAAGWAAHSAHVELARLPKRWERVESAGRFWR
jgi:inorganic triphosphatase YgiF